MDFRFRGNHRCGLLGAENPHKPFCAGVVFLLLLRKPAIVGSARCYTAHENPLD